MCPAEPGRGFSNNYQGSLRLSHGARCGYFKSKIQRSGFVRFYKHCKSYRAVRFCGIFYGAVLCGFYKSENLRCGSMRSSDIVNSKVRFGFVINPTLRLDAVLEKRKILRCGVVL